MTRQVSRERQAAYYVGTGLMAAGAVLFFSVFVTGALNFGNFENFEGRASSSMLRAVGGMALLVVGGIVRGVGARGLAGSGAVLDPERARRDLEPYSRQVGGMAKDALDEAGLTLGGGPGKVVMVRCPGCGQLNNETAKFCQECGRKL